MNIKENVYFVLLFSFIFLKEKGEKLCGSIY